MKTRLHLILLLSLIAWLAPAIHATAQDAGIMDVEYPDGDKDRLDRERIILSPGEADSRYVLKYVTNPKDSASTAKDAASSKAAAPVIPTQQKKIEKVAPSAKPVEKASKNQDDSILSFNFLYYIIEKYKLQDIVD